MHKQIEVDRQRNGLSRWLLLVCRFVPPTELTVIITWDRILPGKDSHDKNALEKRRDKKGARREIKARGAKIRLSHPVNIFHSSTFSRKCQENVVTPLYSSGGPSNMAAVGFSFPKIDTQSSPIFEISAFSAYQTLKAIHLITPSQRSRDVVSGFMTIIRPRATCACVYKRTLCL